MAAMNATLQPKAASQHWRSIHHNTCQGRPPNCCSPQPQQAHACSSTVATVAPAVATSHPHSLVPGAREEVVVPHRKHPHVVLMPLQCPQARERGSVPCLEAAAAGRTGGVSRGKEQHPSDLMDQDIGSQPSTVNSMAKKYKAAKMCGFPSRSQTARPIHLPNQARCPKPTHPNRGVIAAREDNVVRSCQRAHRAIVPHQGGQAFVRVHIPHPHLQPRQMDPGAWRMRHGHTSLCAFFIQQAELKFVGTTQGAATPEPLRGSAASVDGMLAPPLPLQMPSNLAPLQPQPACLTVLSYEPLKILSPQRTSVRTGPWWPRSVAKQVSVSTSQTCRNKHQTASASD